MQIRIEKQNLLDGVQRVQNVVDKKNTIPVLANILFDASQEDNSLKLIATNLEVGMSTVLPVSETTGGNITIPAQKLFEILRELPEATVTLTVDEKNWATIECLKANFKLAGLPKADFPELPTLPTQDIVMLPQATLREMIGKTSFAVSHDESRYALTGVLFSIGNQELSMVATDGHRLALIKRPYQLELAGEEAKDVIIPLKAVTEVKKLCEADGTMSINLGDNQIAFRKEGTMLVSRLIEAQFPDYKQVIPSDSRFSLVANREEFSRVLRRVALLCSDTRLIKFHVSEGQLVLTSNDPNLGEAREVMPVEYTGEELTIGFNARYIMDFLSVISGNEVRIGINDSLSPGLFSSNGEDDAGFACVVMPMRV